MNRWTYWMGALLVLAVGADARAAEPRRYALIIANNLGLDGLAPLSFADDDGARYFELFQAASAQVTLLSVLDPSAQQRFPKAAAVARAPRRGELRAALAELFKKIDADNRAGHSTHFYFVYSGHGSMGPNREGALHLLDGKLPRSELFREVIARSPATFNHLLLDACHAYFVVQKRGQVARESEDYRDALQDFLKREELSSYPNTGVLLAASSESETHEWGEWESGIFSHELRSALMGAADVDNDGGVSYSEAAAFVEAANDSVPNPRAHLRVFFRAPALRVAEPLLRLESFAGASWLRVDPKDAAHYHLEDARGVRTADFHPSPEQPVRVALVGQGPFFVRAQGREAEVPASASEARVGQLVFKSRAVSAKGSLDGTFRKHLFETPFGGGFYKGLVTSLAREPAVPSELTQGLEPRASPHTLRALGIVGLATAAAGGITGGIFYGAAARTHQRYQVEQDPDAARALRAKTEQQTRVANVAFAGAAALGVAGATLWILDAALGSREPLVSPAVALDARGMSLGAAVRW